MRGDNIFNDWESIWLQYKLNDSFAFFRFIAAERTPPPADWTLLQFRPGDSCVATLAGQLALTGLITDRQTSYDATRHQVQLIGKSDTHWGYKSSVDTPTGNFDGQNLQQVFETVVAPFPGSPQVWGTVDPTPFQKLQNEVGELTWDFLERIARPRGAVLGADNFGHYLLIGQHTNPVIATLKEGVNIKACECLISHDYLMTAYNSIGQTSGSDQNHGSSANEQTCTVAGTAAKYSKIITPMPFPVATQAEVCAHAYNEAKWHEGDRITANIVVYGWTWNGTDLWSAGQNVFVDSPMAMLNLVMKLRTVTFEQNSQVGTQTTLELVQPWALNDEVLNPTDPAASGGSQSPTPAVVAPPGAPGIGHA